MDVDAGSHHRPHSIFVRQLGPRRDTLRLGLVDSKPVRSVELHGNVANHLTSVVEVLCDHNAVPVIAEIIEPEESLHGHRAIVPMMTTQCKFQVTNILPAYPSTDPDSPFKRVVFEPRYDQSIPEDQRFHKATPSGRLDIVVDNQQMLAELAVGDTAYITITKAV